MSCDQHICIVLKGLRETRKLSIRGMAETSGLSRETIRKYECGKLIPSNEALDKIFERLDVEEDQQRRVQIAVYQARRSRAGSGNVSYGIAGQADLEFKFSDEQLDDVKADKIVDLFFKEVDPERRTDSFEFFLKGHILNILRS